MLLDQLKKIINDFYTVSDIRAAKELLRVEVVKLMVPDMADAKQAELAKHTVTADTVKQADLSSTARHTAAVRQSVGQHQQPRQRVLRGKCGDTTNCGPKGVPQHLHAFVSRLSAETTAKDLADWLGKVGIEAKCTPVVPKDGRIFRTNAFRVSCDARCAKLFYDEASWPEGCELRDWVFCASRNVGLDNVRDAEDVNQ